MNALVVYDSNYGNTRLIAEAIAMHLGAAAVSVREFRPKDLEGKKLLVAGSPINAWRPTARMKEFLETIKTSGLKGLRASAFDTRVKLFISGNAAKRIAKSLEAAGATLVGTPAGFYVAGGEGPLLKGEIERAKQWAAELKSALATQ